MVAWGFHSAEQRWQTLPNTVARCESYDSQINIVIFECWFWNSPLKGIYVSILFSFLWRLASFLISINDKWWGWTCDSCRHNEKHEMLGLVKIEMPMSGSFWASPGTSWGSWHPDESSLSHSSREVHVNGDTQECHPSPSPCPARCFAPSPGLPWTS